MTAFLRVVGVIFLLAALPLMLLGVAISSAMDKRAGFYATSRQSLDLTGLIAGLLGVAMFCTGPVLLALAAILDSLPGSRTQGGPFGAGLPEQPLGPDGVAPKNEPGRGPAENRSAEPTG